MEPSRGQRARKEALRRSGLEYVDAARAKTSSHNPPSIAPPDAKANTKPAFIAESTRADAEISTVGPSTVGRSAVHAPTPSEKEKLKQLTILREEVAACVACPELASSRTQTVFSDGAPNAELCFIGEAPGEDEDLQGLPFVGRAGQLLTKIIEACRLKREEVYICNVLKCRPPGNRNPAPEEIEQCRPFFERQLDLVKPKMIVALGKFATADLLNIPPDQVPITRWRGQIREYRGIPFMITLHPAYLLRNPSAKVDVWNDMKEVMRRLGRPLD